MSFRKCGKNAALVFAIATVAGLGCSAGISRADSYSSFTSSQILIEPSSAFTGSSATRVTAEASNAANASGFWSYAIMDFASTSLLGPANGGNPGLPSGTVVTDINSLSFQLTEKAESFATVGTVDLYISNNNIAPGTLRYATIAGSSPVAPDPAFQPQGIGNDLGTSSLFNLGQVAYTKTANQVDTLTFNFSGNSALKTYLEGQINSGGNIRMVMAVDNTATSADFVGTTAATTTQRPTLSFDLTTGTVGTTNAVFTINGGLKTQTVTIPRIVVGATATQQISLSNGGTQAGTYTVAGSAGSSGVPAGAGSAGTDPLSGGASTPVSVGMTASGVTAGSSNVSATVTIHNQSNPSDTDAVVTVQAGQVVADRFINNQGGSANGLNFGKILIGATVGGTVTVDTENTGVPDATSATLTTVGLKASTTASGGLTSAPAGDLDSATMAAGTNGDIIFDDGSKSETRNVTFTAAGTKGGLYQTDNFFDGYLPFSLQKLDTAVGADPAPLGRIYFKSDVYQAASVSSSTASNTVSLTNAVHTTNIVTGTTDIGARSSAFVTAVSITAQAGWTVDPGLTTSTEITDGATVTAASFDSTGKLNGNYGGTLNVTMQNDQSITGALPNDLGTQHVTLAATVSGNVGDGSANILPGGSYAGYNITRGSGKNTRVDLLGGTSPGGNTVSVAWSDGTGAAPLSDKAAITGTASDVHVVQLSYVPDAGFANGPVLAVQSGGKFLTAVNLDTGSPDFSEIVGPYDGNPVVGHYGIDKVNHVVWAVLNYDSGNFEAYSRLPGDVNGDGIVSIADLNTLASHWQQSFTGWANADLNGDGVVTIADLNTLVSNWQVQQGGGAGSGMGASEAMALFPSFVAANAPEPASLGLLAVGAMTLISRRRHSAR